MTQWTGLTVIGGKVSFSESGAEFAVNQRVPMGNGSIELRKTTKAGLHVVRFSGSDRFVFALRLGKDGRYRLGADRGHYVVEASEETDPIKRVLREMEIPVSKLTVMREGEVLNISTFSCDIQRSYPVGTTTNRYETDGKEQSKPVSERRVPGSQYCAPEVHAEGKIGGATYAIEIIRRMHGGGVGIYVGRVIVWPGCDPVALADKIAPFIYGQYADADYPAALKDFETAQKWLLKFGIKTSSEKSDTLILEAVNESHIIGGACNLQVMTKLVEVHGMRLIEHYFGEEQRFFLRAMNDVNEAARYVLTHYRVVAVSRGDERHLKFALLATPDKLGNLDSDYLDGRGHDGPLAVLLRKHAGLKDLLYVQADEGIEMVDSYHRLSFIKAENGMWVGQTTRDTDRWHDVRVGKEKDIIFIESERNIFFRMLQCLSSKDRRVGINPHNGGFHAAMRDGDRAYVDGHKAWLLVRPGETKHFVFQIAHEWASSSTGSSIWGITVRRGEDGIAYYAPYDNGLLYNCAGYWGQEVTKVSL